MAPAEKIHLPFRWQFLPVDDPRDHSIRWRWRAFTQGGNLVMESERAFDSLTECLDDAKAKGYGAS
jgi:hypothetical protein